MIDHYENPRNVGSMNKKDFDVGTGLVGAPACGDVMKLQVWYSYTVHCQSFFLQKCFIKQQIWYTYTASVKKTLKIK